MDYFRPFSCSVFHPLGGPLYRLCPSCSQKRTLLLGEYMNEQLLLRLPHKQFVFTPPKVLRVFFRHDKRLRGEISRLVYGLVRDFTTAAAGKCIRTAVVVFQTSGEFSRWNPHWHGLFLEGGFDRDGRFVHVPTVVLAKLSACFRQRVIAFFLECKLLNERLAKNMVTWAHSGFSVDASVRIPAGSTKAREALAQKTSGRMMENTSHASSQKVATSRHRSRKSVRDKPRMGQGYVARASLMPGAVAATARSGRRGKTGRDHVGRPRPRSRYRW